MKNKLKRSTLSALSLFLFFGISKNETPMKTMPLQAKTQQDHIKCGLQLKEVLVVIHLLQSNIRLEAMGRSTKGL